MQALILAAWSFRLLVGAEITRQTATMLAALDRSSTSTVSASSQLAKELFTEKPVSRAVRINSRQLSDGSSMWSMIRLGIINFSESSLSPNCS
jgi:hypothetical protein